jgi:putative lipoprotein
MALWKRPPSRNPLLRRTLLLLAAVLAAPLAGHGAPQAQAQTAEASGLLTVTVSYRERIAPPPDAVLLLELLDVSRADAPSIQLAAQRYRLEAVPQTQELHFDSRLIDPRFSYRVSARILSSGQTLFRTTEAHPVITRGAPTTLEVLLQRSAAPTQSGDAPEAPEALEGRQWTVFEVRGRALIAERPPSLMIEEEGRFGLFAGCNQFAGQMEIGAGSIAFPKPLAGTLKACPEPEERLERDVLDALADSVRYEQNGKLLSFMGEAGAVLLRFRDSSS